MRSAPWLAAAPKKQRLYPCGLGRPGQKVVLRRTIFLGLADTGIRRQNMDASWQLLSG